MTEIQTFEALVRSERSGMLRLAVLLIGSAAEAEEAVQEAFMAVSNRWDNLDNPGGYLRTSVVNSSRQVIRRRELARRHVQDAPRSSWQSTTVEMHDALGKLSDRQRMAVVLRYFADWDDDAIADSLDCRPSTVRSLLRRGLAQLRKDLINDRY